MHRFLVPALLVVLPFGCGNKKDWEHELIVQLFRPAGAQVGTVAVTAKQGQNEGTVEVGDVYADCSSNRVRVILHSPSEPVVIAARSKLDAASFSASTNVTLPVAGPVRLVLRAAPAYDPAACAPAGTPKLGTGSACVSDEECAGGRCLTEVANGPQIDKFPGGYCTRLCDQAACATGERCKAYQNGLGEPSGSYCLLTCEPGSSAACCPIGACRDQHRCTTDNLCMPY